MNDSEEIRISMPSVSKEEKPEHEISSPDSNSVHRNNTMHKTIESSSDTVPPVVAVPFWKSPSQIAAMISNFSTSYNVVNISLVLPILKRLYETNAEDDAACASSLLAGMVVGQVCGGALGDSFLGRLGALRVVMALQIVASLGSALLWDGTHLLWRLALWRFLLGCGAGGVYPLAAVLSAEEGSEAQQQRQQQRQAQLSTPPIQQDAQSSSLDEKMRQLHRVVLTFSMQGIGFLAVPLVTVPLLYLSPNINLIWRLILGLGSIPGLVLLLLQRQFYRAGAVREALPQEDPADDVESPNHQISFEEEPNDAVPTITAPSTDTEDDGSFDSDGFIRVAENPTPSLWESIRNEPDLAQKLVGTAGTWFLFDVLFYGNTLFEPMVLNAAFGGNGTDDELKKTAINSLLVAMIALPGYIISALVIGKRTCHVLQTPRFVQLQGFAAMAMLYATLGAYWSYLTRVPALLVVLYGASFFFANYGPNTTTFVFPSLVYSHDCRSTLNGISAAAGKAGALVGASLFEPAAKEFGDNYVMLLCAGVSVVAFATTRCFVQVPAPVSR